MSKPETFVNVDTGESMEMVKPDARKREDKDFVKLYRKFIFDISELGLDDPKALSVLLFLIRNMDGTNAIICSMDIIGSHTKLTRQTVSNKLKYLQDNGWIEVFKVSRARMYVVNPDIVWTSYADQKEYCQMKASVFITKGDNFAVSRKASGFYKHIDIPAALQMSQSQEVSSDEE